MVHEFHRWLFDILRQGLEGYRLLGVLVVSMAVLTVICVIGAQILGDWWHTRHP